MGATRSGVFVGSSSIGSQERRRFSWPRSKPFKDTHWDQANISVAKAFHFPSESEGEEGGFVQIFRENHGLSLQKEELSFSDHPSFQCALPNWLPSSSSDEQEAVFSSPLSWICMWM